jgi:hypothetical protein
VKEGKTGVSGGNNDTWVGREGYIRGVPRLKEGECVKCEKCDEEQK